MTDPKLIQASSEPPVLWQPHEDQRHAYRPDHYPEGAEVTALCGASIVIARGLGETAWLWLTCPECLMHACRIVGAPTPKGES